MNNNNKRLYPWATSGPTATTPSPSRRHKCRPAIDLFRPQTTCSLRRWWPNLHLLEPSPLRQFWRPPTWFRTAKTHNNNPQRIVTAPHHHRHQLLLPCPRSNTAPLRTLSSNRNSSPTSPIWPDSIAWSNRHSRCPHILKFCLRRNICHISPCDRITSTPRTPSASSNTCQHPRSTICSKCNSCRACVPWLSAWIRKSLPRLRSAWTNRSRLQILSRSQWSRSMRRLRLSCRAFGSM